MSEVLYSIGYATKPMSVFIDQLKRYRITAIADVRSVPYSNAFFDYHQDALRDTLKQQGIHYVYLGKELGPRSENDAHYDECGQVQFDRLMQSELFLQGITRLKRGMEKAQVIALMCAEKDPADCHRSLLIGHALAQQGIELLHIDHHGELESQQQMECRLSRLHGTDSDLFISEGEQGERAMEIQCRHKAYKRPS